MAVGLTGSEDPADSVIFRNLKGRSLPRVPQSGPHNPAMGVLKSSGIPFRACVRRALWRSHYLRAFSGVDTGAPGIISDWCIYGICAVYGFFTCLRATPVVVGHQVTVPPGDCFLSPFFDGRGSYKRGSRVRSYISWNISA